MTTNVCPTCGHKARVARVLKTPYTLGILSRADELVLMADRDAFRAYRARVSLYQDLSFFVRIASGPDARASLSMAQLSEAFTMLDTLTTRAATTADRKAFQRLQDDSRTGNPAREFTFARDRRLADDIKTAASAASLADYADRKAARDAA